MTVVRCATAVMLAAILGTARIHAAGAPSLPTPPKDWKLEVVASAPQVRHPSVVCCAPDGRVFVAEDPMDIRLPSADASQGRIVCVHPDGHVTTFAERLHAVFGMQYLEGKLYVLHNPRFTVFTDDDSGVGKDARDLIACTNPNPWALNWNDHVPANFKLAMDGYFYVAVGDKGLYGATGTDGKRVDMRGGGVVRIRPDGTGLEIFCTGVRNILDLAINDEDEIFTYDNTDEHDWMGRLTHMVDGGFYGYPYDFVPRRPYTLWMMADYGAGAATGTLCHNDDALPADYRGNLFLSDFGKRNLLRVRIERDGATYKAVKREDLFTDVPANFRPVGICFSPAGDAIYVCDWQHVDTKEDVEVGRLLKLTYKGKIKDERPDWYVAAALGKASGATDEQLLAELKHPSFNVRLVAQRRLADRGAKVLEPLKRMLAAPTLSGVPRSHALWAIDAIEGDDVRFGPELLAAVSDSDARLRRQVLRRLGSRRVKEGLPAAVARLTDYDAAVRFQAAAACGRIASPGGVEPLLRAADETDAWVRYAIAKALNRTGRAAPAEWRAVAGGLRSENASVRNCGAAALRDTYDAELVAAVADAVTSDKVPPAGRATAIAVLGPLHHKLPEWKGEWWAYHPALGPPPRKTERWEGTDKVLALLREALDDTAAEVRLAALSTLRDAADPQAAPSIRSIFSKEDNKAVRQQALAALAPCDDGQSTHFLLASLNDASRDRSLDPDVLRALGQLKAAVAVPVMAESARHPSAVLRAAAFDALVATGGEDAADAVIEMLADRSLDVRLGAIRAAGDLGNRAAVPDLMRSFAARETRGAAQAALAQMPDPRAINAYLDGLTSPDFALREKCRSAIREVRDAVLPAVEEAVSRQPSDDVVLELQQIYGDHAKAKAGPLFRVTVNRKHPSEFVNFAVDHTGDARAGERLFAESKSGGVGCATCHTVNGHGGTVGPDLSGVGAKYSRRDLAEAIVYPSKAVREGYQQVVVRTRSGQTFAGPVKTQSPEQITLQEADGTVRTIRTEDVAARKNTGLSPMPEGLHAGLSVQQFADLVSYLESLKTEPSATGR